MIKIMVADDSRIIREGMKKIFSLSEDIEVVCEAGNGYEVLEQLASHIIDIVLLDIEMPIMDGVKTAKLIREQYPQTKIIILTTYKEDEYIFSTIRLGVNGFLLKDSDVENIIFTIKSVDADNYIFDPKIMPRLIDAIDNRVDTVNSKKLNKLTQHVLVIARMIVNGMSNSEIASILFISEGTVKNTVSKILKKMEIKRRTQLNAFFEHEK